MRLDGQQSGLVLAAMFLFIAVAQDRAQQMPIGHATAFNSDMYFGPPNEDKVKMKLAGTEALPQPGGSLEIKNLRVETFSTNGVTQLQAESPLCTYRLIDSTVDSAGHLEVRSGDGRFHTSGEGFCLVLKQDATSLYISNRVHTVIEIGLLKP